MLFLSIWQTIFTAGSSFEKSECIFSNWVLEDDVFGILQSAADPHIQPRNLMECVDEEKRKVTVDWQLCHRLMRQAMHIVDPFEEFEVFLFN